MKISSIMARISKVAGGVKAEYAIAGAFVLVFSTSLGSETITMRTWYPSPYGSYKRVKITESLAAGTPTVPLAINGNIVQTGNFTLTPPKLFSNSSSVRRAVLCRYSFQTAENISERFLAGNRRRR